jgi:putative addiction module killer protein
MNVILEKTDVFHNWLNKLKDRRAKFIINTHLDRILDGNLGVVKSVGDGVFEKKINYGAGYRVYFCNRGLNWIVLLCGGDKSTQSKDINAAKKIKKEVAKW